MAVTYKDIDQLSNKSTLSGSEKIPVSDTQYVTTNQIAALGGGGGSTTDCVHKTGDETVGGDKTFTDDIIVGDASNIKYGASSGGGFTRGYVTTGGDTGNIVFEDLLGEPKAFIISPVNSITDVSGETIIAVIGDSTGTHTVYTTGTQHNYSTAATATYSNGTLSVDVAATGTYFDDFEWNLVYYYGSGTLTFRTAQVQPGSGATSVTFTDANLTAIPAFYATMLESQVNNESYRRVAYYTNEGGGSSATPMGVSFYSSQIHNTTSNFSVSYNNGLVINSGGTNAGGYFHNPGTYTLYYLTSADIGGGGGGSYQSLDAELSAMNTSISAKEATSNKVTSVSAQSTDTQYPSAKLLYDQLALKQGTITVSTSEPTAYQGNNGDIWFVVSS